MPNNFSILEAINAFQYIENASAEEVRSFLKTAEVSMQILKECFQDFFFFRIN